MIWLEPGSDQAVSIQFGEYGDNVRETSPGLLDRFGKMNATLVSDKGETKLNVT